MDNMDYLTVWCHMCSKSFTDKKLLQVHNAYYHLWNSVKITFYDCNICCDRFLQKEVVIKHILEVHAQMKAPAADTNNNSLSQPATASSVNIAPSLEGVSKKNSSLYTGSSFSLLKNRPSEEIAKIEDLAPKSEADTLASETHDEGLERSEAQLTCLLCDDRFSSSSDLLQHLSSVHGTGQPKKQGKEDLSSSVQLGGHKGEAPPSKTEQCATCDSSFSSGQELKDHIQAEHVPMKQCPLCEDKFIAIEALKRHILKCHKLSRAMRCPHCSKDLGNERALQEHIEEIHRSIERVEEKAAGAPAAPGLPDLAPRDSALHCPVCDEEFESEEALATHSAFNHFDSPVKGDAQAAGGSRGHSNESNDSSSLCSASKRSRLDSSSSIESSSSVRMITECQYCHRSFKNPRGLAMHMRKIHKLKNSNNIIRFT